MQIELLMPRRNLLKEELGKVFGDSSQRVMTQGLEKEKPSRIIPNIIRENNHDINEIRRRKFNIEKSTTKGDSNDLLLLENSRKDLILAGGHFKNFSLSENGRTIFKRTNPKEVEFYKRILKENSELIGIVPRLVSISEKDNIIELENLTYGMKNPQVIDIKIGTHSFSGQKRPGFLGAVEASKRYIRWNYRDIRYGFRNRGWRVQGCSWIKDQNRQHIGRKSNKYLNDFIEKCISSEAQKLSIINQLREIAEVIAKSNYGFINSSIMIAVDDNSQPKIKFIDFSHTIKFESIRQKKHSPHNKGLVNGTSKIVDIMQNVRKAK